ncbi:MAG: 8-amino-7-oxononanoate synthase [Verrucomicrobiae bacterium]|nr:8-amino-7-oxononanoate synthase [Verrucomicrobiae bacterium]
MPLADSLRDRLADLDRRHLRRSLQPVEPSVGPRLVIDGRSLLSFASNDYLGLARHPRLQAAALDATRRFGAGSTASRLICGSLAPHHHLEDALAAFKQSESALAFSSGYATALGVVPALVGPGDCVVLDRLAHACLVDAARLSGARLRVFRHNDPDDLRRILQWTRSLPPAPGGRPAQVLILTESVFSMDGDVAPLPDLVGIKDEFDAWLLLDEAHATGTAGPGLRGWADALGLSHRIDIPMGTLGKALGAAGGYVAGPAILREYLVSRARSLLFSTAPPPAAAAAATAALEIVASTEGPRLAACLTRCIDALHAGLAADGWTLPPPRTPILPLTVGDEAGAVRLSRALREEGCLVPAIRYPTVARGQARLRLTAGALHGPEEVATLLAALRRALDRTGIRPR